MSQPSECPDEQAWLLFVAKRLSIVETLLMQEHAESCMDCQTVIEKFSHARPPTPGEVSKPPHDSAEPYTELTNTKLYEKANGSECDSNDFELDELLFDNSLLTASEQPGSLGRLGKYEVHAIIGSGAFGVVLKAFDEQLRRSVAIKILNRQFSSSATARRRFIREARAAAAVSHSNVVAIHAVEEQSGTPFLVMELVTGPSLRNRIAEMIKLPPIEVIRLGAQIASGLAAAHAQGVVHRDIKPGNIMLEKSLDRVKITDFGLARVAIDNIELTSRGMAIGTPAYMAPEQVSGEDVDARSDLFALGCVLHAALVGHSPFHGRSALEMARRVTEYVPPPLHQLDSSIPKFLSDLVEKLLNKKPDERYQSAAEVAGLLNRYLIALNQAPSDKFQSLLHGPLLSPSSKPVLKRAWFARLTSAVLAVVAMVIGVGMWESYQTIKSFQDRKIEGELDQFVVPPQITSTSTDPELEQPTASVKPQELTVSQAGDAQFRTLNEALTRATPQTTIRVLDDAIYRESLRIIGSRRFTGLKLIAENHARLAPPDPSLPTLRLIEISNVNDVLMKGWKIDAPKDGHAIYLVEVGNVTLEDLEIEQPPDVGIFGAIQVHAIRSQSDGPVVITNCLVKTTGPAQCVWIHGTSRPPHEIRLTHNRFERQSGSGSNVAVWMEEDATLVKLTLNENLWIGGDSAINLFLHSPLPAHSVDIINNTFFESRHWLAFDTTQPTEPVARIANNLIIGGERILSPNLEDAIQHWEFRANQWERSSMTDIEPGRGGLIAKSRTAGSLSFLSRDPTHKDFLRPAPDADWLESGTGGKEPKYLGAFGPASTVSQ